ncbi:MAG: hypothetical protein AB1689_27630 [Thermodesulfobacteriota bacterium]
MPDRWPHGSTLSAHRAFVVHFATAGRATRRRYAGRAEHLPSGRVARFSSIKELLAFFATVLDAGPTDPDGQARDESSHPRGRR